MSTAALIEQTGLDDLSAMTSQALEGLYRSAQIPDSVRPLDGHPRGRMLAVRGLDQGSTANFLRTFAGLEGFPWSGKSFRSLSDSEGVGINRVHLGGRHKLFAFRTSLEPSRIDGEPCIKLDYDLDENPWLIRKIHDEVRAIDEGLYLGPAMWKSKQGEVLVLWFALDTHIQVATTTW